MMLKMLKVLSCVRKSREGKLVRPAELSSQAWSETALPCLSDSLNLFVCIDGYAHSMLK